MACFHTKIFQPSSQGRFQKKKELNERDNTMQFIVTDNDKLSREASSSVELLMNTKIIDLDSKMFTYINSLNKMFEYLMLSEIESCYFADFFYL